MSEGEAASAPLSGRPIVFGEVLFDRFPDGEVLGGAPFNVAWHLQGFGCRPLFVSRVGDDEAGRRVREAMETWGLDRTGLQLDGARPTGAVEITLDGAGHTFEILPDQAYDHVEPELAFEMASGVEPAMLYHGSLALRSPTSNRALERLATELAVPIFVDVNLRAPWWQLEDLPHWFDRARWLKVNDEELAEIATGLGHAAPGLEPTARRLQLACGLDRIIVTRGAGGAFVLDARGEVASVAPAARVEVVDTVGAGDAFTSVILLGQLRGWPLESTMRRAQDFASRICGRRGAIGADRELYREVEASW